MHLLRRLTVTTLSLAVAAFVSAAPSTNVRASSQGFLSSFEEGQAQPVRASRTAANNGLRVQVSGGPDASYTSRAGVGFTGVRSLEYSGQSNGAQRVDVVLFDVDQTVAASTELSYRLFPRFDEDGLRYAATYAAVDLLFTDGSRLSQLQAQDQQGFVLSAKAQGQSKTLYTQQWNHKQTRIGAVAAGKVIDKVLLTYEGPEGDYQFRGWLDDIRIHEPEAATTSLSPAEQVLTTRGTHSSGAFSRGNNIPATAVPHGFNFWAPVTDAGSLSWFYEYAKGNDAQNRTRLQALTLTHETSPWMGDRQTFQIMPSSAKGVPAINRVDRSLSFRHENEIAQPHHYRVQLDNGIVAEMTPTDHAAMFRFRFPGDDASLLFDNVDDRGGLSLSPETGELSGYTDTRSGLSNGAERMYVYARFDRPVTASGKLVATDGKDGSTRTRVPGYFRFQLDGSRTLNMRIATSLISVEQAKRNLELEISTQDAFEDVRARAQKAWNDKLSVLAVEGATPDQSTTLYSNLYRLFLYPNAAHENVGTQAAPVWKHVVQSSERSERAADSSETRTAAPIADGKVYVNNGFWDTYRTVWAAYALFSPNDAGEMVNGFVQHYRDGGWVPRWSSPGYANLMTGTSSDVSFADAYVKGVSGIDRDAVYAAMIKNASVRPPNDNVGRKGMDVAPFIGYTPASVGEGVSWALEGYINDYGIANMLATMATEAKDARTRERLQTERDYYHQRARNYRNMFDPSIGFFQGRSVDGKWKSAASDYKPEVWGHDHDYTETNGWGFAFLVPHDGQGLANLYGGRQGLQRKLDEYFATSETAKFPGSYGGVIHEMVEARDVRMGQWGFSNQVAHHVPWMYLYTGQPWRTQEIVREVLDRMYVGSEIGQGYPGDEDNGESSAWWLFAALGFYPLQMGSENLVIGSPLFRKATLQLPNGRSLEVVANNNSRSHRYVSGVRVNGKAWHSTSIPHRVLADGGRIEFDMSERPAQWGSAIEAAPPSLTTAADAPAPMYDVTGAGKGIASAGVAGKSAEALFDNTSKTELVFASTSSAQVSFRLTTSGAEKVQMYTLTSGQSGGHPTAWVLEGSNDGKKWSKLDARSGETFEWSNYTRPFGLAEPASFSHYRLQISKASDPAQFSLAEIELLGASAPSTP